MRGRAFPVIEPATKKETAMNYEEKKQARIDRLRSRSEKAHAEADQRWGIAKQQGELLNGQPILIGHHSEKAHRALINRMATNSRKASEAYERGKEIGRRADAAERNTAVFSDDPEAVTKLRLKIEAAEKRQAMMKEANKIIRSKPKNAPTPDKMKALAAIGLHEEVAEGLFKPDFCNRIGFPAYELTNNNANIRRMKERIETLLEQDNAETTETNHGDVKVVENAEDNRVQIFFPGKPSEEVRRELKSHGFRWARSLGCWQRHRSTNASFYANKIAGGAA